MVEKGNTEIFARNLRVAMAIRNVNQSDVARSTGLSKTIINMLTQGKRVPSIKTLQKLSIALGVSTDYLLGKSGDLK